MEERESEGQTMRPNKQTRILSMLAVLALTMALSPALSSAANEQAPMRMRANGGHPSTGLTTIVDLSIESWSSEAEHDSIMKAAQRSASVPRGDTSLRQALQTKQSHGRISFQGELGIDVRYAYQFEENGGRTIVLAADRPIAAAEASQTGNLSLDYNVTLAVIELDESGRGEGELWAAASIRIDADGRMKAIGINQDPIRLGRIRVVN